jgi:hypothetical protein
MDVAGRVFEDDVVELDTSFRQRDESRDGAQERRFAGAVRSEDGDDLSWCGFDRDVEVERPEPERDLRGQHQNARR